MRDSTHTIKLHRVFKAPPERVYRAFIDPDAMVKWISPYGFTAKVHHMDVRVGGSYRMSFTNFTTQSSHAFGGIYHELKPGELLKYTDTFEPPGPPGQILVTIQFNQVSCGTELCIIQEGIPAVIPAEMCYLGWQESLQQLANLVNAEIPDEG